MNIYLLRLVACLFVLLSFNVKALVVNGCTIEANTSCIGAELSGADLTGADLSYADLSYADLTGADLTGADLSGASLWRADLSFADLTGADLSEAWFANAYLNGADLTNTDLSGALLAGVTLTGAFYDEQTTFRTNFDPVSVDMIYVPTAVPVPAAAWLFGSALASLGLVRRK